MTFRNSSPITKTAARFCNFHYTTKAGSILIVPLHRSSAAASSAVTVNKLTLSLAWLNAWGWHVYVR